MDLCVEDRYKKLKKLKTYTKDIDKVRISMAIY